jgi:acyl dehydratase
VTRNATDRDRKSPVFEDIKPGLELPTLVRGPMTSVHLMRWSATIENWHRIHYDQEFATGHDKLPGLMINGSWKQHFLVQMMCQWLGDEGWLAKIGFQFRAMNVVGETLTAWGRVTDTTERAGFGLVTCEIGIVNEHGTQSTPGTAVAVLPLQSGRPVPYPFPEGLLDA